MAIQTLPGVTGFIYDRVSSMDNRAIGKLTDSNHLEALTHSNAPADYDKKIISIYTQTSLYSNDFLDMLNKSTPYYITQNSDSWKWKINVPYKFPKIIEIPSSTSTLPKPGIDGKEFQFVLDTNEFSKGSKVSLGSRMYGPQVFITQDPTKWNSGWLYTATLFTENPTQDFINAKFFKIGVELEFIDAPTGEFSQEGVGLGRLGQEITMYESLGSGNMVQHTITKWADQKTLKDNNGKPLDILVYAPAQRNAMPLTKNDIRWEPFIEFEMRKKMLNMKVSKMIWAKPGTFLVPGSQELQRTSAGVYHRMRSNGNLVQYNRGEFNVNLLRSVFGDLFYRRVDVKDRKVKMYTNEAGFDVFSQAAKQDALNSGLTLMAQVNAIKEGPVSPTDVTQHLTYSFNFGQVVSRETGTIDLVHLKELDLPQGNLEFGQNKKSTPLFLVFDVSPTSDGTLTNNIREVRQEGAPSMTWGYVDGRQHHLGFASSQGMSSANSFPGYKIWMEDRYDVFIEDLSRTVLIEEIPQL